MVLQKLPTFTLIVTMTTTSQTVAMKSLEIMGLCNQKKKGTEL